MYSFAYIFDLDGTLIDSLGDICGHMNHVRRDFGLAERSQEELVPFIGHGVDYLAGNAIPELGPEKVDEIVTRFRDYYRSEPHVHGAIYPGVRELLSEIQARRAAIAVATNKASDVAEVALKHYLPEFNFQYIAGPDRVSHRKPHRAHLDEVLSKLGIQAQNAVFVGDHDVDQQCAEAAGVRFFGAGYGFGGVQVEPKFMLSKPLDLLEKI